MRLAARAEGCGSTAEGEFRESVVEAINNYVISSIIYNIMFIYIYLYLLAYIYLFFESIYLFICLLIYLFSSSCTCSCSFVVSAV